MAENRCAHCGESRASLTCTRCKLVRYCNKACQAKHWRAGRHRESCKAALNASISAADLKAIVEATTNGDIRRMKQLLMQSDPTKIDQVVKNKI